MIDVAIRTRTVAANGLSFTVDEAGEGDSVALCLHGFPESRIAWRHQLPHLASLGWRAAAPDMRGYGESSRPKGVKAYRVQHLIDDAVALFDALGAKRRLLISHDWGGVIAWALAAKRATPLDGLVVMNAPHPAVYRRAFTSSLKQPLKSWYIAFFQLPGLPEASLRRNNAAAVTKSFTANVSDPSVFEAGVLETFRDNILKPGAATAMINYYRANGGVIWDRTLDRPIDVPTLLVWGEKDFALDLSLTEGNEPYVKDFTLARIPGASHWVQQEAAAQVNAALRNWMKLKGLA